jgi:hypothetical protein
MLYNPGPVQPLPTALEQFLDEGDQPVVFAPGSGHLHAAAYFKTALGAVRRTGCRAVFSPGTACRSLRTYLLARIFQQVARLVCEDIESSLGGLA